MLQPGVSAGADQVFHPAARAGSHHTVFLFFSNRLGCLGSIVLSIVLTVLLLFLLGVL